LGAPFFVQIIEDRSGKPAHILAGLADTSAEGRRLQNAQWRLEVAGLADVVVAQLNDVPERQSIAAFARGLACASRVVKPGGQIILLTGAAPQLSPAFQLLRQADTPDEALSLLKEKEPAGLSAAFQWASAAGRASLFIYSQLDHGIVEELFAAPIADANEAAKLTANGRCVYLADADKALAVCRQEEQQLHKKVKSVSHSKTSV
jgi:hypothetical protein